MTVTSVNTDYNNLTITLIADFEDPIERCGNCGRIHASSSDGGARPAIQRRSRSTSSLRAAR
jgi:hypothetical protein